MIVVVVFNIIPSFTWLPGVNHDELVKLAETHFSGLRSTYEEQDKVETCRFSGSEVCMCILITSSFYRMMALQLGDGDDDDDEGYSISTAAIT